MSATPFDLIDPAALSTIHGGAEPAAPGWGETIGKYVGATIGGGLGAVGGFFAGAPTGPGAAATTGAGGALGGAIGYDAGARLGRVIDTGTPVGPGYGTFPIGGSGGARKDARVCFVAGTRVSTPSGSVPIDTIAPGDLVYGWDARRDAPAVTQVICLETHEHEVVEIFDLGFVGGSSIRVTKGHPFWTGREWIRSENVRSGMNLLAITGSRSVASVVREPTQLRSVYNVRTDAGTYLVGAVGAVVSGLRMEEPTVARVVNLAARRVSVHPTHLER